MLCVQATLELCGRSHSLSDVKEAIQAVHDAKPPSWSLDLISGLPGVSLKEWESTMQHAIQAQPLHLSIYDLQVRCTYCLLIMLHVDLIIV